MAILSTGIAVNRTAVAPGYFDALKIPMLQGRDFTMQDDTSHAPAMIVNAEFVRRYLRGQAAIGRRVHGWGNWFTIVGVVQDSKVYRLSESATPYFYVPIRQVYRPEFPFTFLVRTTGSVEAAVGAIDRGARAIDPTVPVFDAMPLGEYIDAPLNQLKTAASLLGIIASIAFFLAAIGLYGVMADSVAQRTKEIGIRLAMGAQQGDVGRMIVWQATALLAAGLVLGLAGAAALARLVSALLFGVSAGDPVVYAAAAGCMVFIAMLATGIPARRAMRVNPMTALRDE